jgi:hypothetical protein
MSEYTPFKSSTHLGGSHDQYRFRNGYGASVIRNQYSYGGPEGFFELAVLRFEGDESSLCYDTPITDDVKGWLTPRKVTNLLRRIEALPTHTASDD